MEIESWAPVTCFSLARLEDDLTRLQATWRGGEPGGSASPPHPREKAVSDMVIEDAC